MYDIPKMYAHLPQLSTDYTLAGADQSRLNHRVSAKPADCRLLSRGTLQAVKCEHNVVFGSLDLARAFEPLSRNRLTISTHQGFKRCDVLPL